MMQMSEAAEKALINVGTNRQGAVVQGDLGALLELQDEGLIGQNLGLTRMGTIVRQRLMTAELDKAFG